jgi:thiol-disulfide isomerase/thioredoxin
MENSFLQVIGVDAPMKKYARYTITAILLSSCFITLIFFTANTQGENQPAADGNPNVIVEFFYSDGCPACEATKPMIDRIEQYYGSNISVLRLPVNETENQKNF